ncbi:Hsp70 family protein [Butyrivibrio sp. AE2032]|uniref:Hsp70 family protein n=1 Tax=Butyrivibrio sp. AE2032 TaxID=1458463 RepID=UPI0006895B28|nr:Hsp70 family protein [Butyrivibrio sp. AE2032]
MAIIGIDLGTTNSLATLFNEVGVKIVRNALGNALTPSVVGLDDDGNVIVGEIAKERLITHPDMTVAEFKRTMGTDRKYKLGKDTYSSQQLSSILLKKIVADAKDYLGEEIDEAVISVPAYFDDKMRIATKQAAELAGIKCERLINEPSAAALAYLSRNHWKDGTYMVVDFGGGTLDVSIIDSFDSVMEIIAVAGNNQLGGKDFNEAIYRYFLLSNNLLEDSLTAEERAIIYRMSETTKIALSTNPIAVMTVVIRDQEYSLTLDNNKLIEIAHEVFEKIFTPIKKVLKDSRLRPEDLESIVLVGGSSKMPTVAVYIEKVTGVKPCTDIDPDTAIGIGAGIYSGIKMKNQQLKDIVMTDICPFSLGVDTHDYNNDVIMSFIIERNSMLPCSNMRSYYAIHDNQTVVDFKVYQGESIIPENNIYLGTISIGCPPTNKGEFIATVRMTYDINGILLIDVTNVNNETVSKTLIDNNVRLSEKEMEAIKKKLDKLRFEKDTNDEVKLLISRAERIIEESVSFERERLINALSAFKLTMAKGNSIEKRRTMEAFARFLDACDL